jgi:hypothetical protein
MDHPNTGIGIEGFFYLQDTVIMTPIAMDLFIQNTEGKGQLTKQAAYIT